MKVLFIVNVEAAIFREERWLIVQRSAKEAHAAGMISLVGGKVESEENQLDVLERTLRREISEEVGIEVADIMHYVHSTSFVTDDGDPVVDIVFLCQYTDGEAFCKSPDEVDAVRWLTIDQILADEKTPSWTRESLQRADRLRAQLGYSLHSS